MLFVITLFVLISGCLNRYERDIIGSYKVGQYELLDSTKTLTFNLPNLIIKKDKTFLLSFADKKFTGKWESDDYGDWTLATFYMNGSEVKAIIGIESVSINNPRQFHCPLLKTMEFQKIIN